MHFLREQAWQGLQAWQSGLAKRLSENIPLVRPLLSIWLRQSGLLR
jgi:hypothetical protein